MELELLEVKALYFNQNALVAPATILRRADGAGGARFYYEMDDAAHVTWFIGTTSYIDKTIPKSEFLIKWYADKGYENAMEYMYERAEYGTCMHVLFADFLLKKETYFDSKYIHDVLVNAQMNFKYFKSGWYEDLAKDLASFVQFANDYEIEPLAIEIPLASRKLGVAGTIDLVCRMTWKKQRITAIIDLKSGKNVYESAEIQLKTYEIAWNENFPDTKIDRLFNWNPKDFRTENATYLLTDQTNKQSVRKIELLVELYKMDNPVKPGPKMDISGHAKLGRVMDNIRIMDIEEIVKTKSGYMSNPAQVTEKGEVVWVEDSPFATGSIQPVNNWEF